MMKKLFSVILFFCWINTINAQRIISNKLNIQLNYSINDPMGKKSIVNSSYESPSFINNFQTSYSIGIEASYKLGEFFFIHFEVQKSDFENWVDENSERFNEAKYSIYSLSSSFGIRTLFKEEGLLNRFYFFARLGPNFSIQSVKFEQAPYSSANTINFDFSSSTFFAPGINLSAGLNAALSNKIIAGVEYGINHYWVSSVLFDDKTANFSSLSINFGFRFGNNKRYKYTK